MKAMIKRSLVLLIAFAMTFTTGMASVFADEGGGDEAEATVTRLLVLGDSTSSGYELDDFLNYNVSFSQNNSDLEGEWTYDKALEYNDTHAYKKGRISGRSYPWQLKKYIEETEGVDCVLSSMCLNGMRTDELRALLDPAYYERINGLETERTAQDGRIGFLTDHIRSFTNAFHNDGVTVNGSSVRSFDKGGLADAQAYTRQEIENADVIVIDCCTNNFGTYLAERLAGSIGMGGYAYAAAYKNVTIDDIDDVPKEVREMVSQVKKMLREQGLLSDQTEIVENIVDTFLYCYADCATNFAADVKMIRKINPDARIIVTGLYNTLDGVSLVLDGNKVDLGQISDRALGLMNLYIRNLDLNRPYYYYADLSGGVETFMMQIEAADEYTDLPYYLQEKLYTGFMQSHDLDKAVPEGADIDIEDYKAEITQMLVDAADHTDLDVVSMMAAIALGYDVSNEVVAYVSGQSDGMTDAAWGMLQIDERFMMSNGFGQHPGDNGVEDKYQAVRKAYDKYSPEYEAFKGVVKDTVILAKLLRKERSPENCAAVSAKLNDIRTALVKIRKGSKQFDKARLTQLTNELSEYIDRTLVILKDQTEALLRRIRDAKTQEEAEQAQDDLNALSQAVNELPADSSDKKALTAELSAAQKKLDAKAADIEAAEGSGGQAAGDADGTSATQEPAVDDQVHEQTTPATAPEQAAPAPAADTVDAAMPSVKKLSTKASKRAFTVKWKKLSKSQRGLTDTIEVQYSTDPNFASADTKTKTVSDKKTSKKIGGLDKKTKYYVRVRTVSGEADARTVSNWSRRRTVKVR